MNGRVEADLETLGLLDEKRALAAKESLTDDEKSRLGELDERLHGLDLQAPVLTKEQQEKQKELAQQVLAELSARRESEE